MSEGDGKKTHLNLQIAKKPTAAVSGIPAFRNSASMPGWRRTKLQMLTKKAVRKETDDSRQDRSSLGRLRWRPHHATRTSPAESCECSTHARGKAITYSQVPKKTRTCPAPPKVWAAEMRGGATWRVRSLDSSLVAFAGRRPNTHPSGSCRLTGESRLRFSPPLSFHGTATKTKPAISAI